MGVRYEWADERQIIMNVYVEAPWSWAEYKAMITELMPVLRDVNHPCAIAVDCSRVGSLPRDGDFLTTVLNTDKMLPDNHFATMIAAAPYVVRVFMNLAMKLRPRAKRLALFTATMAEAEEKIYARYHQLYPGASES